jgi:hypothetical protein
MFSRLNIGFLFMPFHYGILLLENVVVVSTTKILRHAQICLLIHFLQFPQEANVDQDVLCSGSNLNLPSFFMSWSQFTNVGSSF